MFNWFKPTTQKEDWRLVKTMAEAIVHTTTWRHTGQSKQEEGKIYYHLFESNKGNRKVEYQCTIEIHKLVEDAKRMPLYQEKIYRWEHGRVDPDIPTYDQVPVEETANTLKGKI